DSYGGRSSATPPNAVRRLERKKPAHFSTVEVGFRSIIIFLTVCTHRRRTAAGERGSGQTTHRSMAGCEFLACRSLCHHAGPYSFAVRQIHSLRNHSRTGSASGEIM